MLAVAAGAAETRRTLLVELRQVPEAMRASSGVQAGPGPYSYDSYDRDRILSVVRDVVLMLATPGELAQARAEGLEARVLMESDDQVTLIRRALYGPTFKLAPVYHSYDQITARAQVLARAHPKLIACVQIGETTQFKRPIYA